MRPSLRWALAAAAGTAAAVSWLPDEEADAVAPAIVRGAAPDPAAPSPAPLRLQLRLQAAALPRAALDHAATTEEASTAAGLGPAADPRADWPVLSGAARRAWLPRPAPPPPVPAPVAASAPAPPPAFPYQWLGEIEEDGRTRIFIAGPQRLWAVVPGEVLEQNWRIDGVAAGRLQLTWLVTGAAVTLAARP